VVDAAAAARSRLVANSLFFIAGFSVVFVALGATATSVGQQLRAHQALLSQIGGLIVILFGLHLLGVIRISALYGDKRVHKKIAVSGGVGAFLVGFTFAFGWTPCIGPMLATILLLAANQGTVGHGIFLLAIYSAGLAVPFLLTTLAIDRFATFYKGFRRHLHTVEQVSGVLLLLIGGLLLTHRFTAISGYLAQIPFFNKLLL
jgi:cytochrome c-type biogenesis protein